MYDYWCPNAVRVDVTDFSYIHLFFVDLRCVAVRGIIQKGKLFIDKPKVLDVFLMARSNLNTECKDLELIIDGLVAGKETYHEEETQYSLEEAIEYLRDFLCELKELNGQIIENGNTPELLEEVHKKYTELWLFQLYFYVDSLPRVVGGLWRYPNPNE